MPFLRTNFVDFEDIENPIHGAADIVTIGEKYLTKNSSSYLELVNLSINKLLTSDSLFHDFRFETKPLERYFVKSESSTQIEPSVFGNDSPLTTDSGVIFGYTFNFQP